MLFDCPECGEAYAAEGYSLTMCPTCDAENIATFQRPLGSKKSMRRGAWAAGLSSAFIIFVMATLSWSTLDLDNDGLSTYQEWQEGTDPFNIDSDGDGLIDGWEVSRNLDPTAKDSDGDGITDWAEIQAAISLGRCDLMAHLFDGCDDAPARPESSEALAANASATRMTAWFAVATVAVAGLVGMVTGRTVRNR